MVFGNWKRKSLVKKFEADLKQVYIDPELKERLECISMVEKEVLDAFKDKTIEELPSYLKYIKNNFFSTSLLGIRPSSILCGSITWAVNLAQTAEEFNQYLYKLYELAARLSKDYKDIEATLYRAVRFVPEKVKTISQFEEYLQHYERYFRTSVKPDDTPPYHRDFFAELRKDADTLEEICFGIDCLGLAVEAGIYVYDHVHINRSDYVRVNHRLPNYCIKAARKSSFEEYKQRFSNVISNVGDEVSPEVRSYGVPVVALFANTKEEIKRAFNKLEEFWNRVNKVIQPPEWGVRNHPGESIVELILIVSDYQGYSACLDAVASLWESCEKVALGYGPKKGDWFEQGQIRKAKEEIMGKHYPRIVAMVKTADQLVEYIDAHIKFYEKVSPNSKYKHGGDSIGTRVKSIVDKEVFGRLPVVADTIKKYGDFNVDINVATHIAKWTEDGPHGPETCSGPVMDSVQIDIKASGKVIDSMQIERPAKGWQFGYFGYSQ